MAVIAALLPQANQLQRLRYAIRDRHEIVACADWREVATTCDRTVVRIAVLDLFADGEAAFDRVRRLKQRHPRLALIAYVTGTIGRLRDLFDAGRYGFDALLLAGVDDDPRALLAAVEQAETRSMTGALRKALEGTSPTVSDAVLLAVTRAHERLTVTALARLLAIPQRTLAARLADAGFPPPYRLLTWGRLIVAAHMLEDAHRSADRVALTLGFPSGSAFRNACQRYVHATPGEIRARGGAGYVTRALLRQRAGVRARVSSSRTPALAL